MYIVVAGAGLVGGDLARRLLGNKHDVVVIDEKKEICDKLYSETGVVAVNGDVAQIETLNDADVAKADVVVAATGSDADNLSCAILAKSLGAPQIIVQMRNPSYENAYKLAGADSIIRVTDLMINQMIIEIEKPKARRIVTISRGEADIFAVIVPKGAKIAGQSVKEIAQRDEFPSQCVFIAVNKRETEETTIPRGDQVIREDDELFMISTARDIKKAVNVLTATS